MPPNFSRESLAKLYLPLFHIPPEIHTRYVHIGVEERGAGSDPQRRREHWRGGQQCVLAAQSHVELQGLRRFYSVSPITLCSTVGGGTILLVDRLLIRHTIPAEPIVGEIPPKGQ